MPEIVDAPEPPYYAVIFVAKPTADQREYGETVARVERAYGFARS